MNRIKHWLPEILVFGVILAILLICLNPDYTFMNKAADSIGYAYSADYLYPSYHTSPPLYLLVSHVFLQIPFGTDAWRMGLLSVLCTMGACIFIYLIIRRLMPYKRWYPLLGVLIYGMSAMVISQSIIIQTYPVICMLAAGAYYFAVCKKWKLMGLMIGIGLAIHILMGFVFLVMFIGYREYRKNWRALLITFSFLVFYIYIPLTNRAPYMWFPDPESVNSVWAFVVDTLKTIIFLFGQLSIWDLPKRIFDVIGVMGVSIGVFTIIPIVYYFIKAKILRNVLFWLITVPIIVFISELDMNTFDYMMLSMPFLAIVACLGIDMMFQVYWGRVKVLVAVILIAVIGFGVFNTLYFDLGRSLDKNMSASNLYYNEFAKIPSDAIFMPNYAWEWEAIYKYNADYDKHIYPICIDILPSELYREQLIEDGIVLVSSNNSNPSISSRQVAQSIIELNDNVWTTISTDPSTFGSEVIETNHDINLVAPLDEAKAKDMAENPQIKWMPYNPYSIMDTSIMITDWNYVLVSNKNLLFVVFCGTLTILAVKIVMKIFRKKKKGDS